MTSIEVRKLSKRFGNVLAVDQLDFEVAPGRVTGFLGANGSGKTTTLRILLGLSAPTSGSATFGGRRYVDLDDPIREVGAAIAPDTFHPGRSGVEHLRVMSTAAGIKRSRVDEVLGDVGLADAAGRRVGGYSLGMRQRLSLAAALLGDPRILILDEPLNGLDPDGIAWMRVLLRHLATEGRTVFLSSHLLAEIAQTVDDVVVITDGRLAAAKPLADLGSGTVTVVRTPDATRLLAALTASGYPARIGGTDRVEAPGVPADVVGRIAAQAGIVIAGLAEERDDLEQMFRELTHPKEAQACTSPA
ncbi:MAG: type transport system ATP-binding protein [Acidimicrobiaceae bacterium]|jgi:ABC-2 type transport system ATP-binding protein|nr:type transport system ATP-binding protein [Acidimicrobiaceae bacterium]